MSKNFCIRCHNETVRTGKKQKCTELCKRKTVYFMRGVPSAGKSTTSKLIAGNKGKVIETDSWFGPPGKDFRFIQSKREEAYKWVWKEFKKAVKKEINPIVIDRGNGKSALTKKLVKHAIKHGYHVEFAESISPWWQEIRVLLKFMPDTKKALKKVAVKLEELNRNTHRVKAPTIYERLKRFNLNLKMEDIIE